MTQHFLYIKIKVYSVLVVFVHLQAKHYYLQNIILEALFHFRQRYVFRTPERHYKRSNKRRAIGLNSCMNSQIASVEAVR